jgi:hypothetical protein
MTTLLHARLVIACALLLASGPVLLRGQTTPADVQEPPVPTFRVGGEAVQLTVIVTDAGGNPVTGLTQDDFEILENSARDDVDRRGHSNRAHGADVRRAGRARQRGPARACLPDRAR